jgi:outer membrane protein OmpA-like peptidoglycan-associated protein
MNCISLILLFVACTSAAAQTATPLNTAATEATLGKRIRNPVKSAAPITKRSYGRNAAKGIDVEIIEREDGAREERPYVAVPILFTKAQAELLDTTSQANVTELAAILKRITTAEPNARFSIQGHSSAEGDQATNQKLSEARAARIRQMLLIAGVPETSLSAIGFGPQWATVSATAAEPQLQQDRRVLVVRE